MIISDTASGGGRFMGHAAVEERCTILDCALGVLTDLSSADFHLALLTTGVVVTLARVGDVTYYRLFMSDLTDTEDMEELATLEADHGVCLSRNTVSFEYVPQAHPDLPGSTWHTHHLIASQTEAKA
ncbi:hypothetical protein [Streptomyces sp. ISL-11]|uniref:hypothetical protein n=1 Tax=Streptomyces sp. ISL-11 TaxID=2819174 RepID=UPI001BE959FA|nr:hypothetical protein [Streptomyces sp. ISL-11]MBT2383886.1 hypothetical protein [Streptomyces sp. ISL-11]